MMGFRYTNIMLFLLLAVWSYHTSAQTVVTISSGADTINFGETVDIKIQVNEVDPGQQYLIYDFTKIKNELHLRDSVFFEPYADVFVGFEDKDLYRYYDLQEKSLDIQINPSEQGSNITIPVKIKFLSYGDFIIHPPLYQDKNGNITPLTANPVKVFVRIPPGMDKIEEVDVSEIKPIVEVYESFWSKYGWYLLGLVAAVLLLFLIKKYRDKLKSRPQPQTEQAEILPDPYEVAMQKLHALNKDKPWLTGDIKEYQSILTGTVREYIEGRYAINALEMTSGEIMEQLENKPLSSDLKYDLSDILQVADLVKFAKARPTSDVHQEFLDRAINFVVKTRKFSTV